MGFPTAGGLPGIGSTITTAPEKVITFGPPSWKFDINNGHIDSTAVDAGNSPTTELRAGLIMGKQTSDGNYYQWDAEASDGTERARAILLRGLSMLNAQGVVEDKSWYMLLAGGVKASDLLIKGSALVGHADEYLARRQLVNAGFVFDDDPNPNAIVDMLVSGTTLTPTAAQRNYRFFLSNAASVTVTLPTIKAGLVYEFIRTGDEELVIASAAGGDMIVGNDPAANSLTYTTAGQHIGARVRVEAVRYGSTVKWLPNILVTPFGTTNAGLAFAIAT